ncbi:MAG TPA: M13 family metallopeptidase [Terriglobales bacterium]
MQVCGLLLSVLLCVGALFGESLQGIQVGDMDPKADPCRDFYEYANGAWRANNPIPASMDRWSRRWQAGEANKEKVRTILEEAAAKTEQPKGSISQLTGDFYAACMDMATINKLGIKPLEPSLAEVDAIKDREGLLTMIGRMESVGINVPFGLGPLPDPHNPSEVIADLGASGLGLPDRDYYLKPEERFQKAREEYLVHVADMFQLSGYSKADAKKASDSVMQFETSLAKASLDNVALRDPQVLDHKMTFAEMKQLSPLFDWDEFFTAAKVSRAPLNVEQPKFMQEFNRQLADTSLAEWKTYLKWHLLHDAAPYLSQPFVDANFDFYQKQLAGLSEIKPRWKQCSTAADQYLGEAVGQEYVARYFPPEAKARAQEMVKNILAAMSETVEELDWMSPETKKKAQEKISTFNVKVGYPDKWKDYSSVSISRSAYFEDIEAASKFQVADAWSTIGKPVDRARWGMTPPTSDAYYNPLLNEIVFPAGILQPPAFNVSATDAVNYGAIGVVIGHEVSHGFDDEGAQFDAQGRLNNWWTPDDLKKFQAKTGCVAKQFDGYYIEPTIHHNGKLVLGESIGDLAGVKIAYLAFQNSQKGKPPAPTIDGFTPDQQFFIAWGQFRGDETRPETQRLMVQGDPHPVAKYRVIGPLSNFSPFEKAFSCKADSPMVRSVAERCVVW